MCKLEYIASYNTLLPSISFLSQYPISHNILIPMISYLPQYLTFFNSLHPSYPPSFDALLHKVSFINWYLVSSIPCPHHILAKVTMFLQYLAPYYTTSSMPCLLRYSIPSITCPQYPTSQNTLSKDIQLYDILLIIS